MFFSGWEQSWKYFANVLLRDLISSDFDILAYVEDIESSRFLEYSLCPFTSIQYYHIIFMMQKFRFSEFKVHQPLTGTT